MSIVRCPKGHFYDDEKYISCPSCNGSGSGPRWQMEDEKTISLDAFGGSEVKKIQLTAEVSAQQSVIGTWDSEKTVALSGYESAQLLVGWLVCVEGAMKGNDYRLYSGFNRVGRTMDSDICLQDAEVSREDHCSVVYDEKNSEFYLVPGKGSLTYLNGEPLQKATVIQDGEKIRIGKCMLIFVPFCKGERTWQTM